MVPTVVAAHNTNGMTMHHFFGISNEHNIVDMARLWEHVEVYKKSVFLIDAYSMVSNSFLQPIHSVLLKTTIRNAAMGGMKTFFFFFFGNIWQIEGWSVYCLLWVKRNREWYLAQLPPSGQSKEKVYQRVDLSYADRAMKRRL